MMLHLKIGELRRQYICITFGYTCVTHGLYVSYHLLISSIFYVLYFCSLFARKQTNPQTWARQSDMWIDLIQSYCRHWKQYQLDFPQSLDSPLFFNQTISSEFLSFCHSGIGRLKSDVAKQLLEEMVKRGTILHDNG
jgi:hypothetical protein